MAAEVRGRQPLYIHIASVLRSDMEMGLLRAGARMPRERELVERFDCSRSTVRLAVERLISQELVERRSPRVVVVRSGTSVMEEGPAVIPNSVGIILDSWNTNASRVLRSCQSALRQFSYSAIVCDSGYGNPNDSVSREAQHVRTLIAKGVRGLILCPAHERYELSFFKQAQAAGLSLVMVDREIPGVECDYIGVDNTGGGYQATQHLISRGHRRIAHLTHPVRPTSLEQRLDGYRNALQEAGIGYDERLVMPMWPHGQKHELEAALGQILSLANHPTAFFCATDHLAVVAIAVLRSFGFRVPCDAAVVGFDDDVFAKWTEAPLTTVAQPFETIGEEAVHLLMSRVRDGFTGSPRRVILPVQLLLRQSCGSHTSDNL